MFFLIYIILAIVENCLPALFETILIEGIFVFWVTKKKKYVSESILCNVITNPVLNVISCIIILAGGSNFIKNIWIAVAEILVVFVETHIYLKRTDLDFRKSFWLSYTANLLSLSVGFFTQGKYIQCVLPILLYSIVSMTVHEIKKQK